MKLHCSRKRSLVFGISIASVLKKEEKISQYLWECLFYPPSHSSRFSLEDVLESVCWDNNRENQMIKNYRKNLIKAGMRRNSFWEKKLFRVTTKAMCYSDLHVYISLHFISSTLFILQFTHIYYCWFYGKKRAYTTEKNYI
jgi:hypothetical protein